MKTSCLLLLFAALAAVQIVPAQDGYIFSGTDINGNAIDVQAWLDEDKPVLIYDFTLADGTLWLLHEDGAAAELYNTLGQGGSNEIAVIYVAGFGFDEVADVTSFDLSAVLGAGYEDLDLTENNPIPIVLATDNPGLNAYPKGQRLWLCPQNGPVYLPYSSVPADDLSDQLMQGCCTTLESDRMSLAWPSSVLFDPACDPGALSYTLINETGFDVGSTAVDVYLNGDFAETLLYEEVLEGCETVTLDYSNPAIGAGDEVTLAFGQPNAALYTDTVTTLREEVYTTGTTVKTELISPADSWSYFFYQCSGNGGNGLVNAGVNWADYLFLSPGCYHLTLTGAEGETENSLILVGTVDENNQYTDTVYYGALISPEQQLRFTLQAAGEPAAQKVWGYVFEDADGAGTFLPDFPRIAGVQVNYGSLTAFTDAEGYYEFPEVIPLEAVTLQYDADSWPVMTTPNAGNVGTDNYIHNFGLNADDPVWSLTTNYDAGLPYICEWGILNTVTVSNAGNQPTSGELVFTHDPLFTPIGFNPAPVAVNGNEITFAVGEISYGWMQNFTVTYEDISADLLGEPVTASYTVTTFNDEGNAVGTEEGTLTDTLYCAFDPNDKFGFPLGAGPEGFILPDTPLKYRIRFQNTGNLPAATVVIRDTLPETLNADSFEPLSASHPYTVTLDHATREAVWTFNQIMLPDSASDPAGSIGTLWFDIEMNDLSLGTQIENTAYIYFDQNAPIVTNTSLHTIQDILSSPIQNSAGFSVFPNPTDHTFFVAGDFAETERIRVTDLFGRTVREQSAARREVDVSGLAGGVYLVIAGQRKAEKLMVVNNR